MVAVLVPISGRTRPSDCTTASSKAGQQQRSRSSLTSSSSACGTLCRTGHPITQKPRCTLTPGLSPLPGELEGDYFYSLRDTDINGPCSGKTILEVVKVLSSAGTMAPDSIYIYNSSITNNDWEPWSPGLIGKIAEDTALVAGARRVRISVSPTPSTPYVSSDCPWPPPPAAPLAPSTSDRQVPPPRRETVS